MAGKNPFGKKPVKGGKAMTGGKKFGRGRC
jgi:hypothetical protein